MEFYAVLGLDQIPRKFRSVGESSEFYCYFPPPLPDLVVIFCLKCENTSSRSVKDGMCVQLHLDGENDSICKIIGDITAENKAVCFDNFWENEEKLLAKEIQEKGRLIKLIISPKSSMSVANDGSLSQDSGVSEILHLSPDAAKEIEGSLDQENDVKNAKPVTKNQQQELVTSPLLERNRTPKKQASVKRKAMFEFDDPDDDENAKHVKMDSKIHSKSKLSPKVMLSPLSVKPKKINDFFTPKSSKSSKKNDFVTPKSSKSKSSSCKKSLPGMLSPVTPGIFELEEPTARWGHSMCQTVDQKAILVGGQGLRHQMCKDSLWQYDFAKSSWNRLEEADDNKGASRRMGHTAVYDEKSQQIYIFGGCKNKKWFSDIHTLNANTFEWKSVEVTGKAPARSYHSCTLSNEELLIFGGVFPNPDPVPDGCSNDVHFFNTVSNSWYQPIVSGEKPQPRSGHSASLIQGKLFIFGGWDAPTCFNDLWTLDLGLMNFKLIETTGNAPPPRSWHGSTLTRDNQSIIIHGGYNGEKALNDVYMLKLTSMTWNHLADNSLLARAGHLLINVKTLNNSKKQEEKIIIFGGGDNNGKFFHDICELQTQS